MAFQGYADLKSAVQDFLNRSDIPTSIDTLIDLGQRRVRREQEGDRRIYSYEGAPVNGALPITQQGQVLPAGVRIIKSLWPTSGSDYRPLEQTTFDELRTRAGGNLDATGTPRLYAIVPVVDPSLAGPRLFLWPKPTTDGSYLIDFLYVIDQGNFTAQNIPALYTYAPDLYLYAALSESAPFLKHDERVPVWESKYGVALASVNGQPDKQATGAALQRPKLRPLGA